MTSAQREIVCDLVEHVIDGVASGAMLKAEGMKLIMDVIDGKSATEVNTMMEHEHALRQPSVGPR